MATIKGFFFVVSIFLILGYILVSVSIWTKALQESESRFSDKFRTSNLEIVANEVTQEKLTRLSGIVVYNSLWNLNNYALGHPIKANGKSGDANEFLYVNKTFYELVTVGVADKNNFVNAISNFDIGKDNSFAGWMERLNGSISKTGMQITNFGLDDFSINQADGHTITYKFQLLLEIEEKDGLASLTKEYNISGNVSIEGLVDPLIYRQSKNINMPKSIQKQFFFYDRYTNSSNFTPEDTGITIKEGQGWFYGPMVASSDADKIPKDQMSRYILVGKYDDIASLQAKASFGAYILTNSPDKTPSLACPGNNDEQKTINALYFKNNDCNKPKIDPGSWAVAVKNPFAVIENFNINSGGKCPDGRCILFVTKYAPAEVYSDPDKKLQAAGKAYNIENLRDFTLCSYYVHNYESPSYFQRLFSDGYTRFSNDYGIETFLVGKYIGGKGNDAGIIINNPNDEKSRADPEFFTNAAGDRIRGMPGCRDSNMCSGDSLLGHFTLGKNSKNDFLDKQDISCANNMARCDQ